MREQEEIDAAWVVLAEHELGPGVGMTEHCVCGWEWSARPVTSGYDAGCWAREEAVEILSAMGLI